MTQILSWMVGLPYHLSVGAVVLNKDGMVLVHHWKRHPKLKNSEIYLLMRETPEPNESLESAVARGLAEEFGISAILKEYIGSTIKKFNHGQKDQKIEKTTAYFLCVDPKELPTGRPKEDIESDSELLWVDPKSLAKASYEQSVETGRADLDESEIIHRVMGIIEKRG